MCRATLPPLYLPLRPNSQVSRQQNRRRVDPDFDWPMHIFGASKKSRNRSLSVGGEISRRPAGWLSLFKCTHRISNCGVQTTDLPVNLNAFCLCHVESPLLYSLRMRYMLLLDRIVHLNSATFSIHFVFYDLESQVQPLQKGGREWWFCFTLQGGA